MYVSVCVSINKISQKILVEAFLLTQGGNKNNRPGLKVCVCVWGGGGLKFGLNDKRQEKHFRVAITPKRSELRV